MKNKTPIKERKRPKKKWEEIGTTVNQKGKIYVQIKNKEQTTMNGAYLNTIRQKTKKQY